MKASGSLAWISRVAFTAASVAALGLWMRPAAGDLTMRFEPNWESLKHYEVPKWYLDAKFGIFIHWGVYCVPAFGNEWYPRNMYRQGSAEFKHHVETYGPQLEFGYKDLIPKFTAERFDAAQWAALFKKAGAKYVVPVAEHHDGFAMYDCGLSDWCAARMGPKRDIVGELAAAVRKEGLVFGASSHRAEHWWFFNGGRAFDCDVKTGQWDDLYGPAAPEGTQPDEAFLDNWLARTCELVDKYQPQVVWFDWWIEQPVFAPYLQKFAAYYYNRGLEWNRGVAINYKNESFPPDAAVLDIERGKLDKTRDLFWQTDTSISVKSWGYIDNDHFRSVASLVHELVDIVSKNGCLLLNIGPKSDGTIPEEAEAILLGIGEWLRINGEAIYGTRPWIVSGEGPTEAKAGSFSDHLEKPFTAEDVRFTVKDGALYAICLGWPEKDFRIAALGSKTLPDAKIEKVELLGASDALEWKREADAMVVRPPSSSPCKDAYVLKIALSGRTMGSLDVTADANSRLLAEVVVGNYDRAEWKGAVNLLVDGTVAAMQEVALAPMAKQRVRFEHAPGAAGLFNVAVETGNGRTDAVAVLAPRLSFEGEWRFRTGDDSAWKSPDLNDGDWEVVKLPAAWEDHSKYTGDKVFGWYRKRVSIPKEWEGRTLELTLGKIDDVDETYFNGQKIGGMGEFPPDYRSAFGEVRRYVVPRGIVKFGGENVIAIRVFDDGGRGGLYSGPLGPVKVIEH